MDAEAEDVLLVGIGSQSFAFSTAHVSGVLQMMEPTPVPAWPENAVGLLDLHGELFPLVDPAPAVGQPTSELCSTQYIVIVDALQKRWGVIVDRVEGVRTAPIRPIEVPDAQRPDEGRPPYVGMMVGTELPVVVLDPSRLMRTLRVGDLDIYSQEQR